MVGKIDYMYGFIWKGFIKVAKGYKFNLGNFDIVLEFFMFFLS